MEAYSWYNKQQHAYKITMATCLGCHCYLICKKFIVDIFKLVLKTSENLVSKFNFLFFPILQSDH